MSFMSSVGGGAMSVSTLPPTSAQLQHREFMRSGGEGADAAAAAAQAQEALASTVFDDMNNGAPNTPASATL
ncbi:MAG: hypothetical protein EOO41_02685 [Methanobacteriota archaeon]|nr:MAG: hypothetical protein EOO41_02685 [Euryarchaeota archaeon]